MCSKIKLFATLFSCMLSASAWAVVPVHINSGNPKFPFPQFLHYQYGDSHKLENLGTINPEGVVHIEMEQDIRDAYQIFANEWEYTGEVMDGVKYIRGNLGCPYDCREGDGYSMLAAAVMGDKESFDGLWFRIHDSFRPSSKSYLTGTTIGGGGYGDLIIGDQANTCSATDGDNEIVLALYIAWRQWGDDSGRTAANGEKISYKKDLIEVTRGLVAMYEERFKTENPRRVTTGDVGLDGYLKGGTTWSEVTDWATTNTYTANGVEYVPEYKGPVSMHTDYASSAYFKEFYDLILELDVPESNEWEREQYRRCEASTDWVVHNWMSQNAKNIFWGEEATISRDNVVTMTAGNQGGRFRGAWRTALNYVWHGNPDYTWDPVTHTVKDGGNTYEKNSCERITAFMNDPQGWNGPSGCTEFGGGPSVSYKGPSTLHWDIMPDGKFPKSEFIFNWQMATGMPSAIGAQDLDLAGILYRQCNIEWDIVEPGDGYLTSVPHYFHGFFRWLGMVIATGNHIAPSQIKAQANMKIYRGIKDSVTCAYTGDEITYLLDYRNFGTIDAEDVVIVENVPEDFIFVSASNGGVYNASNHTVTWNIGKVSGFKSDNSSGPALNLKSPNLAATMGQVSYTCKIGPKAFGRYCTTADITCSNGLGWTSNEYPNYTTATMQRNCVDVIKRALLIEKTADREKVNPGNMVTYKINFENSSEAGWLDGGRPRVTLAVSNNLDGAQLWLRFRLYNDAIEPYINYGNYRVAYYMYDSGLDCIAGQEGCTTGWQWNKSVYEGGRTNTDDVTLVHETIVEGKDENGSWNQRLCLQFSPMLVTTTAHLSNYFGMTQRVHKGGSAPLRVFGYLNASNWSTPNYKDDWSWNAGAADAEDGFYHPVSPSWQNIDPTTGKSIEIPVTEYLPSICEKPSHVIENILVEEYDGYVWRRILGTGPMAGREARNVVVIDTLPKGMTFEAFQNECPLSEYGASWDKYKIADGRWVVKWEIPIMQVKQKGSIIYTATAEFPSGKSCETADEETHNVAWILADKNSPIGDTASVTVTCAKVPVPIVPTTLSKTVDKEEVEEGDNVLYTIEYEQTHGAIFDNALTNASDWTVNGASITGGALSISSGTKATFKYSKSKNIYVEMDAEIANDQTGEIFLRDNIRLQFMYNSSNGMTVTCYDGNKKVGDQLVSLKSNPSRWRLKLTDDVLQVWFGKDTSAGPAFTAAGLTEKEGLFGFEGVAWGTFKYSKMHIHTDYAYNLSIIDRKPAEISFISADEGGALEGDSIVWKFEQGMDKPIPFGKKYTVTWKGKVDECNELIINEAYAKLLGHSIDEIRAQAVSKCGSSCKISSAQIALDKDKLCTGESTTLTATATPAGTYTYEFFLDGVSLGAASATTSIAVDKAGDYTVKAADPADATCFKESAPATLEVNAPTDPALAAIDPFCEGETASLASDEGIAWYSDAAATTTANSDLTALEGKTTPYEFYYTYTNEAGCVFGPQKYEVTIKPYAEASFDTLMECGKTSIPQVTLYPDIPSLTQTWTLDGEAISSPSSFTTAGIAGELSLTLSADGYCDSKSSEDNKKTISVKAAATAPIVADMEYVQGTGCANIDAKEGAEIKPNEATNSLLWYDANKTLLGSTAPCHDLTTKDEGTKYYVSEVTPDGCESPLAEFTIKVNDAPRPTVYDTTVCEGGEVDLATLAVTESSDFKTRWYTDPSAAKGTGEATAPTITNAEVGKYEYYVSQYSTITGAESDMATITITVVGVKKPTVEDHSYCAGETIDALETFVTEVNDEANGYYSGSGLEWTLDGASIPATTLLTTNVTTTTEYVLGVAQTYQVNPQSVCAGEAATFTVKVVKITEPIVNGSIVYTTGDLDASGNLTQTITEKNANAVALSAEGGSLEWFDANKNPLGATAPTPTSDPTKVANGEDQEFTYYVRQTENGCNSELVPVTVIISSSPRPITRNLNLCDGEPLDGRKLGDLVDIDANGGAASDYTLRWYDDASKAGNGVDFIAEPSLPNTITDATKVQEVHTFYVTQVNKENAESGYSEVIVTIYARPVIEPVDLPAVCATSVDLTKAWTQTFGTTITEEEYQLAGSAITQTAVTDNADYTMKGWFTVPAPGNQAVCASDPIALKYRIDELSNVAISGSATACPNSEVALSVGYETNVTSGVTILWSGDVQNANAESTKTNPLAGVAPDTHTFGVTITAGACELSDDNFVITLGKGILSGTILATETDNDSIGATPYAAESGAVTIYSCGSAVTLTANLEATATTFDWASLTGTESASGKEAIFAPTTETTYRLTFENECEATLDVTIVPVPLTVTATKSAETVCEGEPFELRMTVDCAEQPAVAWLKDAAKVSEQALYNIAAAQTTDAGVYSFEARNRGCYVSGEVGEVKVKPYAKVVEPTAPYIVERGGDLTIILDITANATEPQIAWIENAQKVNDGASYALTNITEDHSFQVQLEGDDYCQTTISVEVLADAAATVVLSGDKDKICLGETLTLTADTAGTGKVLDPAQYSILWEAKSGAAFAALAGQGGTTEMTVSPTMDVDYRVTVYYKDQIVSSEEFAVAVYSPATFTQPAEQTICEGESAEITIANISFTDATVEWEAESSITSSLDGETIQAEPLETTIYRFTVSREIGCPVEGTATVNVTAKTELSVTEDTTICSGDKVTISAKAVRGEANEFIWTDMVTGETLANTGSLTVMPTEDATYRVTVDGGVCGLTQAEVTITVGQIPTIDTVNVVARKTVDVLASGGDGNYQYKVGATGEYGTENRLEVLRYTAYDFYVIDGNGCETKKNFKLEAPEIIFNPVFTPNGDGIDDVWEATNLAEAYPEAVVTIYDRYGKKLCEMKASDGAWDGTYNGKKMPATDYWYEVNIDEIDKLYVGHFTLVR